MQESWSRDKKDVITHRVKKIIDNWPGHVIWGYDKQMSQLSPTYKDLVDNFSVPSRIGVANQKRIEKNPSWVHYTNKSWCDIVLEGDSTMTS